ncbi:MAG: glycosyltransferase family 39 protein [Lachnospiraceae bacterium]|nr:glycosyltransferase family 39 protein [Lachnospiraceae bacterium]
MFYGAWMLVQPYGVAPDETMRYDIPMYIYKFGVLPGGDDPLLIDNAWGLSYAYFPILSYMISALFMKAVSVFSTEPVVLLMAARSISLLCGVGTAFMSLKIGRKLFGNRMGLLFAVFVAFLPQNIFISSYVNNDALAIFSTSLIVWFWIRGIETRWDIKACIGLAVSISICALSYYNAYGFILCSIILFFASYKTVDKKTALIVGIVFVLAGWWFIRNAVLYEGDFLGMRTCDAVAELHAWPEVRPSALSTPMSQGMSIFDMLFKTNWIFSVAGSFIGCFGGMDVKLPMWMYIVAGVFFLVGIILLAIKGRDIFSSKKGNTFLPGFFGNEGYGTRALFSWIMLLAIIIPNILNMYNSYANDYQPQGRYSLPMIIPLFYFITLGYQAELGDDGEKHKRAVIIMGAACIIFALLAFALAFLPAYAGKDMFYLAAPRLI